MNGLLSKLRQELEIRNFSKKTIRSYLYSVEKFLEFSKGKGLNENTVKDYIQNQIKTKNPSTIAHSVFAISFFFNKVLKQDINIPRPKRNKTIPDILTVSEIRGLINFTSNVKHKLIIKLLYGCGLRVSEIVNLKPNDIDFNENLIYIRLGKGKKDRFVKIPESIKKELNIFLDISSREYLFESNRGGKLTKDTIQKIVQNSAKKADIKKRVYPHLLRHSFATHLIENGYDVSKVQSLLGHKSPETTFTYLHIASPSMIKVISPLDKL